MDYNVPFDEFDRYDLIAMSRNAWEHVNYYRERDVDPSVKRGACWLTAAQEQKFEESPSLERQEEQGGRSTHGRSVARKRAAFTRG